MADADVVDCCGSQCDDASILPLTTPCELEEVTVVGCEDEYDEAMGSNG